MSQTNTSAPGALLETQVAAATANPEAMTAAVAASQAAPAPADPLEQRLQSIEQTVATYAPVIQMLQDTVGTLVPGAAGVVSRVEQLENWAAALVSHFQHKVPSPGA